MYKHLSISLEYLEMCDVYFERRSRALLRIHVIKCEQECSVYV